MLIVSNSKTGAGAGKCSDGLNYETAKNKSLSYSVFIRSFS